MCFEIKKIFCYGRPVSTPAIMKKGRQPKTNCTSTAKKLFSCLFDIIPQLFSLQPQKLNFYSPPPLRRCLSGLGTLTYYVLIKIYTPSPLVHSSSILVNPPLQTHHVDSTVSTSFQRGIHVVCLQGPSCEQSKLPPKPPPHPSQTQ